MDADTLSLRFLTLFWRGFTAITGSSRPPLRFSMVPRVGAPSRSATRAQVKRFKSFFTHDFSMALNKRTDCFLLDTLALLSFLSTTYLRVYSTTLFSYNSLT